ncbi:MAG: EAL domain-containing protein [Hydrogenophaga sp.]|nr:EAL domain-containing protein [Hydrogenophaga sp.]
MVHLQPVVPLTTSRAVPLYSECLARLRISGGIQLQPAEFLPYLDGCGGIPVLDCAMFERVLDELDADGSSCFGCNIAPATLANTSALDRIFRNIKSRPWLASRLIVEVTEASPLRDVPDYKRRLRGIQDLGCRLAIDDFGSGFATPALLRDVDVEWDIVKVEWRDHSPRGLAEFGALVAVARSMAPVIVAERIETGEQVAEARAAGATHGQGYLFNDNRGVHLADQDTEAPLDATVLSAPRDPSRDDALSQGGIVAWRHGRKAGHE